MHYFEIYRAGKLQYITFDENFKEKLKVLNQNDFEEWTFEKKYSYRKPCEIATFLSEES